MRIHVVNLPHTETTRDFVWCAYTEKVRKFCNMMYDLGHEVYLYAGEHNEARCTERVVVADRAQQAKWFPDWDAETTVWPGWDSGAIWWREFNQRAVHEIRQRSSNGDILGLIAGHCQRPIADQLSELIPVEWGVGYSGVFTKSRVFESYSWMHHIYGELHESWGNYFDAVIPNSFELDDFLFSDRKGHNLVYLGRMIESKGLQVVQELAQHYPVVTAGQGSERVAGAEHIGVVRGHEKAQLLAEAKAVLVPTRYIEPFGGVAVEAMLSGTPVITSDWGAFTETVAHGVSGFRCRMLGEFLDAVDRCEELKPSQIRQHALRYTTEAVAPMYDAYFQQIETLKTDGWYNEDFRLRDLRYA